MVRAWVLAVVMLAGCSGLSAVDAGASTQDAAVLDSGAEFDAGPAVDCATLDEARCVAPSCARLTGWQGADAGAHYTDLPLRYAGCIANPGLVGPLCGTAFSWAAPADGGVCWLFSNTCKPQGWVSSRGADPHCPQFP